MYLFTGEDLLGELPVFCFVALDAVVDAVVGVPKPQYRRVISKQLARLRCHFWRERERERERKREREREREREGDRIY